MLEIQQLQRGVDDTGNITESLPVEQGPLCYMDSYNKNFEQDSEEKNMFLSSGFFLKFKLFTKYTQTQSAYSSICCHVFLFKCFPKAAQHFPYVPSTLLSHLFFLVAVMLTQAKRNKIPHVTSSRSLLLVPNISYSFINLLL